MMSIMRKIHQWENRFDQSAERFAFRHPLLAFFAVFVGAPVIVLLAVVFLAMLCTSFAAVLFG